MKTTAQLSSILISSLLASILLLSCSKKDSGLGHYGQLPGGSTGEEVGTLDSIKATSFKIYMTGLASSTSYNEVHVDIQGVEYNASESDTATVGWEEVPLVYAGSVNVMQLLQGGSIRMDEFGVPLDARQLRIRFGTDNFIVRDGQMQSLTLPDSIRDNGVRVKTIVDAGNRLPAFYLTFDVTNSIFYSSNDDTYTLVPSMNGFENANAGALEGYVAPVDSKAIVYISPESLTRSDLITNTLIIDTLRNGHFKFVGLPEGFYQLEVIANDNSNRRSLITNIQVNLKQTTSIDTTYLQ